jgi:hypothetical protein
VAHKKFSDSAMALAVANAPPGVSRAVFAAGIVGCSWATAQLYIMRTERPAEYKKWFKRHQDQGFKRRGTDRYATHRKPPSVPEPAAIETALRLTEGNAYAAGRLGCSKTPIRNYIVSERKKGRSVGNRRNVFVGTDLETPIIIRKSKKVVPRGQDELLDGLRQLAFDLGIAA